MNKRILFTAGFILTATVAIVAYGAVTTQTLVGTGADGGSGDQAWTNPGNITADDTNQATNLNLGTGDSTNFLHGTMGANQFTIPAGTIDGIEFEYKVRANNSNDMIEDNVFLIIGGTRTGTDKADGNNYSSTATVHNIGGVADLWGTTPSVGQVNATNFGVALKVTDDGSGSGDDVWVYYMKITVTYTPSGGSATNQTRMIL